MDDGRTFGGLLKRYRRAAHLTQLELAERAGYSSHYVSMLERGVRAAQPLTVDVLADALQLADADRASLHGALEPSPPMVWPGQAVPTRPTPLIGREADIVSAVRLLRRDDVRLLALTGPGGVGKTSLAAHMAGTLDSEFADGVAFVDLAVVSEPGDIIPAIARALGLREMGRGSVRERLIAFLGEREMLLLLDSFERVLEGAAIVGNLVAACPHIKLLITSRAPLRLRVEQELRVQPLALPESGIPQAWEGLVHVPAVALFLRSALLVRPDMVFGDAEAAVVADICRHLDGLPLAIELAAARVTHLPLATLRDRLDDRLRILTGGTRDLPARQQRMRDTIAWSYDLLDPAEQRLFRQLSVFAGRWRLDAAEAVCTIEDPAGDVLDGLRALVDGSLIISMDNVPDEPYFRMLDTIREYAAEQLAAAGERDVMMRRHSEYYVRLAEEAEPGLQGGDQERWYRRLTWEHDNIRVALEWLLEVGDAEMALRLAGAVWRFWQRHGDLREGRHWLERGLAAGDRVEAGVREKAYWGASWLAHHQGDYERSRALSTEHLELARERGDALSIRNALTGLGMATLAEGRYREAIRLLQDALDVCKPLGDVWHRATSFMNLGVATLLDGDLRRAEGLFAEALRLHRERGDAVFTARVLQHFGYIALLQGDYARAEEVFQESLHALFELGETIGIADGLEAMAAERAACGRIQETGQLMGVASVLREDIGVAPQAFLRVIWEPYVARAEELLGKTAWEVAKAEGREMSLQEVVETATGWRRGSRG